MKGIDDLKTSVKLFAGFGIVVVLMLVIAWVGYSAMQELDKDVSTLYLDRTLPIQQTGVADSTLFKLRGDLYKLVLAPDRRSETKEAILKDLQTIEEQIDLYRASFLVAEEKAALADYDKAYVAFKQAVQEVITFIENGDENSAVTSLLDGGNASNARKPVDAALKQIIEINVTLAEQLHEDADNRFNSSRAILFAVAGVAVLLAVLFGTLITRSITTPLEVVVKIAKGLAVGDLAREISDAEKDKVRRRKDEIGEVGQAFDGVIAYLQETGDAAKAIANNDLTIAVHQKNEKDELRAAFTRMVTSLRQSLGEVSSHANSLGAASAQLSTAAEQAGRATSQIAMTIQQVSRGITQETGAVTKTTGSIEQMSRAIDGVAKGAQEQAQAVQKAAGITGQINTAIQQVALNAQSVTEEAGKASSSAQDGANKVKLTLKGMESIRSTVGLSAEKVAKMGGHSERITLIVETIEDIASQTNLLALNAAIEAARAGEHGKGFAVVADEVRKLAERASASTREIGALIREIQTTVKEAVAAMEDGSREVENGVMQANEAGEALDRILKSISMVTAQAEQAAAAAQQMNASGSQLVTAVETVSAVVEENTASTEEMAAGSSEVMQAIENIASVSEENSAAVEEVSASTEEMSAQVEEVAASARSMEEMAQELKDLVSRFRLAH